MIDGISPGLPHTAHLPPGKEWALHVAKPVAAWALRSWWRVQVHGSEHVPPSGPVVLAANHIGLLDGPLLVAMTRRSTFAMAKRELFAAPGGWLLAHVGQISLDRHQVDLHAMRRAVQVLRAGKVLAVFPEGVRVSGELAWAKGGAAYLAMVAGAPVVPVAILGTREPGQTRHQLPRRGGPIHLVYGAPIPIAHQPWPRRKHVVAAVTEELRRRLADHVVAAQTLTGLPLPGPPQRTRARTSGRASALEP